MSWLVSYYDDKVKNNLLNWPPKLLAKYLRIIDLIEIEGPDLGMPLTRAMGDGLFEIRVKAMEGIGRALFCILLDEEIVILYEFIKKTDKTPLKAIKIAKRRMRDI